MVSEYDVRRYAEKHPDCWYAVDENSNIIDKSDGKIVCTLKTMTEHLRRELHCDFESVYYCHGTLQNTIRCRECGTVIFASDDEWDYDPNLCCPTCGGYKTRLEYWTAEEIKADEKKRNTIAMIHKHYEDLSEIAALRRRMEIMDEQNHVQEWQPKRKRKRKDINT